VKWLTANRIITIGGEQMALLDKLKQIWVSEKIPAYEKQASLTDEDRQKKSCR
jgi:hypothetical protein